MNNQIFHGDVNKHAGGINLFRIQDFFVRKHESVLRVHDFFVRKHDSVLRIHDFFVRKHYNIDKIMIKSVIGRGPDNNHNNNNNLRRIRGVRKE